MARKQKRYHYIYKTTCSVTGKYYVGMHSTDNLEDGYVGSGRRLWLSINKHGLKNHTKEILEFLESRQALKDRETQLVNDELLKDPMCMNLSIGGEGGNGSRFLSKEQLSKGGKNSLTKLWQDPEYRKKMKLVTSDNLRKGNPDGIATFTNRTHSLETKKKMSDKAKLRVGDKSSQYDTCWISNEQTRRTIKIKNSNLLSYLQNGWIKGRKLPS